MNAISLKAYAKINLFLEVLGKRPDGYHDLSSVMHPISLYDVISVCFSDTPGIHITSNCPYLPNDDRNIAYKCAQMFFTAIKQEPYVNIHIEKKIPTQAGLGGGSCDGATVLKALNRLYNDKYTTEQLCMLSRYVGADIAFCVVESASLCEGIGDVITPCDSLPDCEILVIQGKYRVSTKGAYSRLDSRKSTQIRSNIIPELLKSKDLGKICSNMYNCFEELCEFVEKDKKKIRSFGALGTVMSGSGSAIIGFFDNMEKAKKAKAFFRSQGYFAELCKPI